MKNEIDLRDKKFFKIGIMILLLVLCIVGFFYGNIKGTMEVLSLIHI